MVLMPMQVSYSMMCKLLNRPEVSESSMTSEQLEELQQSMGNLVSAGCLRVTKTASGEAHEIVYAPGYSPPLGEHVGLAGKGGSHLSKADSAMEKAMELVRRAAEQGASNVPQLAAVAGGGGGVLLGRGRRKRTLSASTLRGRTPGHTRSRTKRSR